MTEIEFGQGDTLQCFAQNVPDTPGVLLYLWYRNGTELIGSEDRISIATFPAGGGSALTFTNAMFEDSTSYTCLVYEQSPTIDGVSSTTQLIVFGKTLTSSNNPIELTDW